MYCTSCGAANPVSDKECARCGAALPDLSPVIIRSYLVPAVLVS